MSNTVYLNAEIPAPNGNYVYVMEIMKEDGLSTGEFLYIEAAPGAFKPNHPYKIGKVKVP